jgi:hypothetical protein
MDRRMVQRLIIIAVMLVSSFASGQCTAQSARPQAIGAVSRIQGEGIGTNGSATRPLGLNSSVFLNDGAGRSTIRRSAYSSSKAR